MNTIIDSSEIYGIKIFDGASEYYANDIKSVASKILTSINIKHRQGSVCILLERSSEYITTIIASWSSGLYVIPLNASWSMQKKLSIINRVKPSILVVEDDFDVSQVDILTIKKSELFTLIDSQDFKFKELKPNDIAYVIFTSGSTGEPKGVVISAMAYRAYIDWTQRYFSDYSSCERLLLTSELTFDITMGDLAFALAFGTHIGVARQHTNIPSILAMIMKYEIDLLYSVPTTHLALINFAQKKRKADLTSLKLIISGGERFPWQMVKDYSVLSNGASFYNVYGPTEVTINCFAIRLDEIASFIELDSPVPIGYCFDSLDYLLLDDKSLHNKKEGELCIIGPQIMQGYYDDVIKTNNAIITDPRLPFIPRPMYKTGDLAYIQDGLMYLKGRADGLVKVKGYRIHPDEVSKAIDSLNNIDSNCVIAVEKENEVKLLAFIKLKDNHNEDVKMIENSLSNLLPTYMIPSNCIFINEFPLNQSGKIDKNVLKKEYNERIR